jgi:hypothetical protein
MPTVVSLPLDVVRFRLVPFDRINTGIPHEQKTSVAGNVEGLLVRRDLIESEAQGNNRGQ